jgi:nicotinamide-nucleotide amidase
VSLGWVLVNIELVNTGSELLLGRVLNTHQQWICRQLSDHGYTVNRQVAIGDGSQDIRHAVREALERADLVITTGGLGPTCDDVTRERIAELLGRKLQQVPEIEAAIRQYFESRGRTPPAKTRVESFVPEGADWLKNQFGTAPGLVISVDPNPFRASRERSLLIMLPGPPRELRPMFRDQVLPLLAREFPRTDGFVCRTLKTTGLGESLMEERLEGPLKPLVEVGMELGFCARMGEVDVRFVARGPRAESIVAEAERLTLESAGEFVFGSGDDQLESVVVREMSARCQTLALAESCTGGHIANRITNVPGASAVFLAGLVTYHNDAKIQLLGVLPATLAAHGAVSEPVAREMAEGARKATGADFAVAVTGVAGPGGGSKEKPVGTVFLALSSMEGTIVLRQLNAFERETFKHLTTQQALAMLRRAVLKTSPALA